MKNLPSIVWFRQDLRLADNPALLAAAALGPVVPVFIWAPDEEAAFPPGGATKWWLHQSLAALQKSLTQAGAPLVVRSGNSSLDVLRELIAVTGATRVFWNRRYEPASIERDRIVKTTLREQGIEVESSNAGLLFEPWTVANKSGRAFQVFTPFYKHCVAQFAISPPVPGPATLTAGPPCAGLTITALGLEPKLDWAAQMKQMWRPGEAGAHAALARMVESGVTAYPTERDRPDHLGTSRLSPHIHFGEISPRQIWQAVRAQYGSAPAAEPFLRQLVWREFAHHLLFHFPHTPLQPLRAEFEKFAWRQDPAALRAWQRGLTGYPIVDAGMRELWATGWMHNRVRMIVASFLVKHLRLHWEEGAFWFWDTLLDADLANNTLGWQWSAGCGADAAPYFRIFNPVLQGEKFDPQAVYVRRWVPELAALPDRWIHQPWNCPPLELQLAGIELGRDYPRPVVDHATARAGALAAFQSLRAEGRQEKA